MKTLLRISAALLLFPLFASAQDNPVSVEKVDFDTVKSDYSREDWVAIEIEIEGGKNPSSSARNPRFNDLVSVTFTIGYDTENANERFSFYQAEATLVTLEMGEKASVFFFIPPEIVKRDNLPKEPFAWMVELETEGGPVRMEKENLSTLLNGLVRKAGSAEKGLAQFRSQAASGISKTEGVMVPIYETHFYSPSYRYLKVTPSYVRKK